MHSWHICSLHFYCILWFLLRICHSYVWPVPEYDQLILIILVSLHVDTSSLPVEQPHTFQINFNSLYTALCEQQRSDQATLLLYTLLHQNANMRTYMLSRTDMDNLVGRNEATKRLCSFTECGAHIFLSESDIFIKVKANNTIMKWTIMNYEFYRSGYVSDIVSCWTSAMGQLTVKMYVVAAGAVLPMWDSASYCL